MSDESTDTAARIAALLTEALHATETSGGWWGHPECEEFGNLIAPLLVEAGVGFVAPEIEDLRAVCDAYGLPHSALALDRHLQNNAAETIANWKSVAEHWEGRVAQAKAENQRLQRLVTYYEDKYSEAWDEAPARAAREDGA